MMKGEMSGEQFVQIVRQALVDGQQLGGYRTISVQPHVKLVDGEGVERQFDLYWEFELDGCVRRNVIACMDYVDEIQIDKANELAVELKSFPELQGIIATRGAIQPGVIKQVQAAGIDVIVVRDEDPVGSWRDASGVPLLREIDIKLHCTVPWRLKSFSPEVDKKWCEANGISVLHYNCSLKDVIVDDVTSGVRRSVEEIVDKEGVKERGEHVLRRPYEEAYLLAPNQPKVRIKGFELAYYGSYSIEDSVRIKPDALGIIEYVGQKRKSLKKEGPVKGHAVCVLSD